jgi:hypothetical protein
MTHGFFGLDLGYKKRKHMTTQPISDRTIRGFLVLLLGTLTVVISSCMDGKSGAGGGDELECTKCIDKKPAPTPFSNTLNGINHAITHAQALTMLNNFTTQGQNLLTPELRGLGTLPVYETFNLKAIDSIICQPKTIGFRVYMAMDAQQKVRFVLVGVDGDGKDVLQRKKENPAGSYSANEYSVLVEEAGQRWP